MDTGWETIALFSVDWLIRLGLIVRVILRKQPGSAGLAWIMTLLLLPLAGGVLYLTIGENRQGRERTERAAAIHDRYQAHLASLRERAVVNWAALPPASERIGLQIEHEVGMPAQAGHELTLMHDSVDMLRAIAGDIRAARHSCLLEFYIWSEGGVADDVALALMETAGRGVDCHVLVDAVGSKHFMKSQWPARLREAGVELVEALPVRPGRFQFARADLRTHRKIAVIDSTIAYTGSLNIADPGLFKQDAGVGHWVDTMVRFAGPTVESLEVTFRVDWELATGEQLPPLPEPLRAIAFRAEGITPPHGETVQAAPSGPGVAPEAVHALLLTTIYLARRELVLTTPYFVPDESMIIALTSAARRGVDVTLVVPEKVNSKLVALASRSFFVDLLEAGVKVVEYEAGLLHSKTATIDGEISLIGSANLDMRSFWINFEITLAVYGEHFTASVRSLQAAYIARSRPLTAESLAGVSWSRRLAQSTARLVGPLL